MHQYSPTKLIKLSNITCPYCGVEFRAGIDLNEDHVIGRKFVPKGSLAKQWNLVLLVCVSCNNDKSVLENEISAITLQPNAFGEFASADPLVSVEARRKGTTKSHRTGKPVRVSNESSIRTWPIFPGVTTTLKFTGPPQADRDRVYTLAHYHVAAFFYLITYDQSTKRGVYWPGNFSPIMETSKGDWGNVTMRAFMAQTRTWQERLIGTAANGYFRIMMRRHPENAPVWAWAVEWNRSRRVIGFCGEDESVDRAIAALPTPKWHTLPGERFRLDEPLNAEDDSLFS